MSERSRKTTKQSAAVAGAAVIAWTLSVTVGVDVPGHVESSLGVLLGALAKIVGDKL